MISLDEGTTILTQDEMVQELSRAPNEARPAPVISVALPASHPALRNVAKEDLALLAPAFGQPILV